MRGFILKTLLFMLLSLGAYVSIRLTKYYLHQRSDETRNFNSAFVDKLQLLQTNRDQKKIILYGGSSVGFGLSAAQIEKATGIKTINLGHHAGFGLVDFRDFVLQNLTKEDIIVFSPEWHFYPEPETFDEPTLSNLINNNLSYGKILGKVNYMARALLIFPNEHAAQQEPYTYHSLNANGDVDAHCGLPSKPPLDYKVPNKDFHYTNFLKAFSFIKNYRTIVLFPPTQIRVYEKSKNWMNNIEYQLRANGLNVADSVHYNVYPDTDFFDANYHLNCTARKVRTDSLISALQQAGFVQRIK